MIFAFDMDGTLASLYSVQGWLSALHSEDTTPYAVAAPMIDMARVSRILNNLRSIGHEVHVITWTAKGGSPEYNRKVAKVKKAWLNRYGFPYDEIHVLDYGVNKNIPVAHISGKHILFDDSDEVLSTWNGIAVDVKTTDIIGYLEKVAA